MMFINPIPFIPFPLIRGWGIIVLREAKPLFDSPSKERGKILFLKGIFTPIFAPSIHLDK